MRLHAIMEVTVKESGDTMPQVVVVNAEKMNFDGKLDFSVLSDSVAVYPSSTPEKLLQRIQGAQVVVTKELPVPAALLEQFPRSVQLLVEAGTGYNNIDLAAAKKQGITVCNIPSLQLPAGGPYGHYAAVKPGFHHAGPAGMLAKGDHRNFTQHLLVPHTEVNGKTLGIIGAGHIGKQVIKIAQALEMHILVHTRTPREDGDGIQYVGLKELLQKSDYVSLHCPLTPSTRHLLNRETLALMKPSAFLINTSRGALIDEPTLIEALENHQIAGAGLDVQEQEPPAENNPLYTLPNVILTPHMGWKGLETRQRLVSIIAQDIHQFLAGSPINVVG